MNRLSDLVINAAAKLYLVFGAQPNQTTSRDKRTR